MSAALLAAEGFELPPVQELFEFPPILLRDVELLGIPLAINRTVLLMFLAAAIVCGLMVAAFRNGKVVPGKLQLVMEGVVQFVREQVAVLVIGPEGNRYVPFLTALFLFIFVNNFFEIAPFINFPPTGRMAIPAFLAIVSWTVFVIVGIKEQGAFRYVRNVALPGGVPWYVLPLAIPIELVSTFLVRPVTLAIRLFANMMAGHIILTLMFLAMNAFLFDVHDLSFNLRGLPVGLAALAFGPAIVAFELVVGILQAYIFSILTAVYIAGALHPEH